MKRIRIVPIARRSGRRNALLSAWNGFCLVTLLLLNASPGLAQNPPAEAAPEEPIVLIVYDSQTGNTAALAGAVAQGANRISGVKVWSLKVADVRKDQVVAASAIILGSPTYFANMSSSLKEFIEVHFANEPTTLFNKIGGAFATGGGRTGGKELVVQSLLMAMLNAGMIVAGPLYESWGTFGVSAATADSGDEGVSESELADARRLGERIARLVKMNGN